MLVENEMSRYSSHSDLHSLLTAPIHSTRRKVFVSYHHDGDQYYYNKFSRNFHEQYEAVRDNSLARTIQSDDVEYVMRQIREQYITGTSCTLVLIGARTHERKYVDWEIKATLEKGHGLVGIVLPTHIKNVNGDIIVPERFLDNYLTGYASWGHWSDLTVLGLTQLIDSAIQKPKFQINNYRQMRQRNG